MKVVVLGNGNAGKYILDYFSKLYDVINLTRSDFDAIKPDTNLFEKVINDDDIVINCIGVLKPDINRNGITNTIRINGLFPGVIQRICESKKAQFFHICSDCVFNGRRGNYTEDDLPNATDVYARSKALVKRGNVIRTSFIGKHSGLMKWVLNNKGSVIDGFDNCLWNGVTAYELCHFIQKVITDKLFWDGIYHLHSPETLSKYELCELINNEYNLNITINKKEAKSIEGTVINGVLNRSLKCKKNIGYNVQSIKKQLHELRCLDDGRFSK